MRKDLVSAAFRVWRIGQEPGRSIHDLVAIDELMRFMDGHWTPEERAKIKEMLGRVKDA